MFMFFTIFFLRASPFWWFLFVILNCGSGLWTETLCISGDRIRRFSAVGLVWSCLILMVKGRTLEFSCLLDKFLKREIAFSNSGVNCCLVDWFGEKTRHTCFEQKFYGIFFSKSGAGEYLISRTGSGDDRVNRVKYRYTVFSYFTIIENFENAVSNA